MDKTGTLARCPVCGGPLVTDYERGEVVCAQCGLVLSESAIDVGPEWRVLNERDERRVRAAPLRLVVKTDMAVKMEHGVRWFSLARLHRETLHDQERRLAAIGAELKRIKECVGLPQRAVEEAVALVKRYFDTVAGFPPGAVAAAALWVSLKVAGEPRPLKDVLRCSKTEERWVRKAAWRLKEVMGLSRPSIEDYVKTLAARVNLPTPVVKSAVELLERNKRLLAGKNPWVWAAAALWLASKKDELLKALAEAAGSTPPSVRNAAKRMRV